MRVHQRRRPVQPRVDWSQRNSLQDSEAVTEGSEATPKILVRKIIDGAPALKRQ